MIANNFFNIGSLNRIYNGGALNSFTIKNHENIKRVEEFDINLYELLLKKIFKEESKARLRGLRGKKRTDLSQRIMTKQYGILDVFHYYRERFNYSGFHYLDADGQMLNQVELNRFYNASFEVIISVAKCFIEYLSLNTDSALKNKLDEIKI